MTPLICVWRVKVICRSLSLLSSAMADFHVQPRLVRAELGGVGRFQCQIHGLPEPVISWERDGRSVDTSDDRYYRKYTCLHTMTFKGMYPVLLAQDLIPLTVGLSMSVFSVQVYSVAHRCAADNGCSPWGQWDVLLCCTQQCRSQTQCRSTAHSLRYAQKFFSAFLSLLT